MKYAKIDGHDYYNMVVHASNKLEEQSEYVNSLNVFPVPDGDTGTNMSMTFKAAVREIKNINSDDIGEVSRKLAKGALMGARGNSGVILSQIFRGIAKGLENKKAVSSKELADAFHEGTKSAYKAVMKPTEGTILTVMRAASDEAARYSKADIAGFMKEVVLAAEAMLDRTQEMLPALKKAKVVDSGGMGLVIILNGMYMAIKEGVRPVPGDVVKVSSEVRKPQDFESEDIEFGYCTEFIITGSASKADQLKEKISSLGESVVVVEDEDVIKVHIHSNDPGAVLSQAVLFGELSKIKIDNMREDHRNLFTESYEEIPEEKSDDEKKAYGFISVAMGDGIQDIFSDLGVDYIIDGGQTMNPSTQDIINAIDKIDAEHIFVLPNNSNIQLAAKQAAELSEKDVRVIPSKTIPQGITCIALFDPEEAVQNNENIMNEALGAVKSASVTYAVRDTEIDGMHIKKGDIIGLNEDKISEVGEDAFAVSEKLLSNMVDKDSELITVLYGSDISDEKAKEFASKLEDKYEDLDITVYKGNQPLYYFIMSVE